ncbi:hypothetical protein GMES_3619 [Paraglaciecola mesophila KMM 241]|uniref:Uncharacterized protein n=1 Tax=Paraglaciecola mesophila KMM 241 TaxID=1128912 RepID=K6YPK4_9ALTE|nr:hypothetical protein GMES_3619 [Paraglaciecola mesophila KMM 241]
MGFAHGAPLRCLLTLRKLSALLIMPCVTQQHTLRVPAIPAGYDRSFTLSQSLLL